MSNWLLTGDPAVGWQVRRDVLGQPAGDYLPVRNRVATQGWGAARLAERDSEGSWGGGWYMPKWISTFYTLQTLGLLGLSADNPDAGASADYLLDRATAGYVTGQPAHWARDVCVVGMLLRTATTFGRAEHHRIDRFADFVLSHQLPDGGWNCRSPRAKVGHSSFHTTLSVLEGLHATGLAPAEQAAGQEFLLAHRLFRSHRTGEVVHPGLTRFSFPRYWHYDVLRALEHLAAAGAVRDPRADDAVQLVRDGRRRDGTWNLGPKHPGQTWLTMEVGGRPSQMITLGALRVLRWWEGPTA